MTTTAPANTAPEYTESSVQSNDHGAWQAAIARAPKSGISVSEAAAAYAAKRLQKRGTPLSAVRMGVKGGSCSGYSYVIQFDDDGPRERDYAYVVNGVRFVIDKKSFAFLAGSTLDYERSLMFEGFKFRNPQEASTCGCGHSFTVK